MLLLAKLLQECALQAWSRVLQAAAHAKGKLLGNSL
jgi:hypothetical protein